jgi:hypothetical protein
LIVSSIADAAYSRQNVPERERKHFFLYIDEIPLVHHWSFIDMLSELRKYAFGIVAATQFGARLDGTVLKLILGNAGSIISFRVGATDVAIIAK